jgi:hypothetical protein
MGFGLSHHGGGHQPHRLPDANTQPHHPAWTLAHQIAWAVTGKPDHWARTGYPHFWAILTRGPLEALPLVAPYAR